MAKQKYVFNSESLRFDRIDKSLREKVLSFFLYAIIYCAFAVLLNVVFTRFFETPKEQNLRREQADILLNYTLLNKQLDEMEELLAEIQQRDDKIYRPVFEENPIPRSIREAGFGGVNRYAHLETIKESSMVISTAKRLDKILKQLYIQSKSYDKIVTLAKNKDKLIASLPAIQPVAIKDLTRISSYFGVRTDPFTGALKMHEGMDFSGSVGTDIYATGDGVVVYANYSREGYGSIIIIDHGYGYSTRYAHLNKILVTEGQQVKRGEVIGLMGNTGRSKGPHLHYEVRKNKKALNPVNFYFNDITSEQYDMMIRKSAEEGGQTMD